MGRGDYFKLGDHNAICYVCGFKYKASEMKQRWDGVYVCMQDWEPRQPQDFVRSAPEETAPEWTQPEATDVFIGTILAPLGNIIVGTPLVYSAGNLLTSGVDYTITLPTGQITLITIPAMNAALTWTGTWLDNAGVSTAYVQFQFAKYNGLTNNYQIYGVA